MLPSSTWEGKHPPTILNMFLQFFILKKLYQHFFIVSNFTFTIMDKLFKLENEMKFRI